LSAYGKLLNGLFPFILARTMSTFTAVGTWRLTSGFVVPGAGTV
jgi:hypothetical protein